MKLLSVPYNNTRALSLNVLREIPASALKIQKISAAELFPVTVDLSFCDLSQVDGNTTFFEQALIQALARKSGAKIALEMGTFDGKTSTNLALNLGPDAKIITIDLPAGNMSDAALTIGKSDERYIQKERIGTKINSGKNIQQLYGDTATFDFSPWYGLCDFVFVDACHEYDYVHKDTDTALLLAKPGATILWHDYGTWDGVVRALNERYQSDVRCRSMRHIADTALVIMTAE
jgi:predicted O-methyltransferase YrrM